MEKPNKDDYVTGEGNDMRFKDYLIDMVSYLAENGNEEAKEFPTKMMAEIFPDDMNVTGDPRDYEPLARLLLQRLIRSGFAAEIFDPMLSEIGSNIEEMKRISTEGPARPVPGMNIPKRNVMSDEERVNAMAEALLERIVDKLTPALLKAAATGRVSELKERITELDNALNDVTEMMTPAGAEPDEGISLGQQKLQEIIDYTHFFIRIIDEEQTSADDFNRFLNTLIGHLIGERVDEINAEVMLHPDKHADHDAGDCSIHDAAELGIPPMYVLWRRYYGGEQGDSPLEALSDLAAVFFDAFHNTIEFVGIAVHPGLEKPLMSSLNDNIPDNDELREETFKLFSEFVRNHPEVMKSLEKQHEGDDRAAIMVNMYATTPNLKIMDDSYHKTIDNSAIDSFESLSGDIDEAIQKLLETE